MTDQAAIFQAIADALGVPLDYDAERAYWLGSVTVDGIPVTLQLGNGSDRIQVSVPAPCYTNEQGQHRTVSLGLHLVDGRYVRRTTPRITVSRNRAPQAAAADIRRRCIEPAKPLYAEMLALADRYTAEGQAQDLNRQRLVALGGTTITHNTSKVWHQHWTAEVSHDGISLDLRRLPPDMAEFIIRYVNGNLEE
jgi:hypothetical protein